MRASRILQIINWWTAIRNDAHNYTKFKQIFKNKFWSESIQNIIRDNLYNGRYDSTRGQTLTAYILGKVCVARHQEPRIQEECLVTKISYHFEEGITCQTVWTSENERRNGTPLGEL